MTKSQAVRRYLKYNAEALMMVRRLMGWHPKKDVAWNAKKLRLERACASTFAHNFHLPCVKYMWLMHPRTLAMVKLRKTATLAEVGKKFGITRERVRQIVKAYKETA